MFPLGDLFVCQFSGSFGLSGGGGGDDKVYLHVCNLRLLMNYDKVNIL